MKKNKFVNGLGATLALAVVALATMFTSCSNEDITVNVKPVNAKAVIKAVVMVDGVDVTTNATISYSEGDGTYEAVSIPEKSISVTATYKDLTETKIVNIPALKAGEAWFQTVSFVMNHNYGTQNFQVVEVTNSSKKETSYTETKVVDNPSDYWLNIPVKYTEKTGAEIVSYEIYSDNEELKQLINSMNTATTKEKEVEVPVMSHSRLTVAVETITTTTSYTVILKTKSGETTLAKFTLKEYTQTGLKSDGTLPIPNHGHAPAGHGHGYGPDHGHGNDNAGGGIIFAD